MHTVTETIQELFKRGDRRSAFRARQLLFLNSPLSKVVEHYLHDNEGNKQGLSNFPMLKQIYDNLPRRLLLKCSRKTLKSTLLSNIITLNLIRYNNYKMLYVGPNEKFTKYFSSTYISARCNSPAIKRIVQGLRKDDVFEKILEDTDSSVLLGYAHDDATRMRGPATDQNFHDEVQDMLYDILPIIKETMTMSKIKRECFAGTPLTTDNTINRLWLGSKQIEWYTKCTGCNHWNALTEDNEPMKMIRPEGLACSKCSRLLDTSKGLWVAHNQDPKCDLDGYHLAQPILPHFNQNPKEWAEIYKKVNNKDYSIGQVHNEVFGLAYDLGTKPITEAQLKACCVLEGPMKDLFMKRRNNYRCISMGVDWGVSMAASRTAACIVGLRDDMVCEVFFAKIFKDLEHNDHIRQLAEMANAYNAFVASDCGPDPNRGIMLAEMTDPAKAQLVSYRNTKLIQSQDIPTDAISWKQYRWVLHRSDTISFVINQIKEKRIIFPQWDQVSDCMKDIINISIEVKDTALRHELRYTHLETAPDDFLHALNFAVVQAHVWARNMLLSGPSSSDYNPLDFFN